MKLWEVTNGYVGFCVVRVYVIARNEKRAVEIAREKFESNSNLYSEDYYEKLNAECMCGNVTKEYVSEIIDE